ncbi:hypothetical protein ASPSYDRAFT_48743 [Aspergillus sydowii CBS 593.65]|uniref:Major facilitator superfamily (MFS) profile domain-containing protein n=1 Tax=Aspergillus sydowii CBS 593.65 TaxID=1036612 RepID=A0A1L9T8C2_9EURO|nr:uncharacterized protein ASPSYDRAFT_48743 [Aspergillus sydowii CBS 593.65]OJJ55533.1 hypothetical protein ASPSYDRAFT_48743 [Aspergillus sydowii CBS 593.65]
MANGKALAEHVEESNYQSPTESSSEKDHHAPAFHFDPKAEGRLRRKIDWYIVPTVSLMYLFCFIDRANIGNARLAGLEDDLDMAGYDYNTLLSVFYISYIVFEIPSNIACKWMGPGWFLPAITLAFGICSVGTAFVHSFNSACGVRFLLGVFEAGMFPGIAYYLSRWYRKAELALRLSIYLVMAPLAGAFGGLLASGILNLSSFGSLHTWRMIFAIEGIITIGIGALAFLTLTDRPETAAWLSKEEKELAISRVRSEYEHAGAREVLDKLDKKKLTRGIFNPVVQATSWIMLLACVTVQGLAFFAPTIVRTIYPEKSTIEQQLQTVPPYIVGAFSTILIPYLSGRFNKRLGLFIITPIFMMVGYIIFLATDNSRARYGATFLIAFGSFPVGVLTTAHASVNVVSDTARAAAIGTVVMMGNIGGLVATWSFLPFDGPDYPIGNGLNLATGSTCLLIAIGMLIWSKWDNGRREEAGERSGRRLDGLSARQIEDLEWRHPAFRWLL